jgi:NADPH-dependent 2,4-dienoyl-CoA reductase/sulfur reductase-like enzyme
MKSRSVIIVGAGPAGMAAALAVIAAGLRPLVIDENPRPGGQIYRQPPTALEIHAAHKSTNPLVRSFCEQLKCMDLMLGAIAWGIFPPRHVAVVHEGRSQVIETQHLIIAPGAHEYLPPFPGWTLPGVMTPGAAQGLVKTMGVRPGKRALIAGTGPFLLVVADQLHRAGVEIVGVVELASRGEAFRAARGLLANPGLLWEAARLHVRLRLARIPIHRGHVLIEARGTDEVREAVFAPCDADGRPHRSQARTVEVDTVCAGYGFVPRIQLAQLAGCRLRFTEELGGWTPEVIEDFQTSVPGIWVAGDGGGVAGALAAQLEGSITGFAVARQLRSLDEKTFLSKTGPLRKRLARLTRSRVALDRAFRLRPGLAELADPETVLCRCEELTRAEVERGIDAGGKDVRTLKVITRLGMGPCQGLMCWPATARLIAARTGKPVAAVGPASVRPPIGPIFLGDLLAEQPATRVEGHA